MPAITGRNAVVLVDLNEAGGARVVRECAAAGRAVFQTADVIGEADVSHQGRRNGPRLRPVVPEEMSPARKRVL